VGMGIGTTGTVGNGDKFLSPCSCLDYTDISAYPSIKLNVMFAGIVILLYVEFTSTNALPGNF